MRLRPLPLVVVPGLLQLVSARRARAAFRRENRAGGDSERSLGLLGTWGWGRAQRRELGALL